MKPLISWPLLILILGLSANMVWSQADANNLVDRTIEQPRGFGHVIGDILTQRIFLGDETKKTIVTAQPEPDRIDLWFERRQSRVETNSEGQQWLVFEYQIVNSPRETVTVQLPSFTVSTNVHSEISVDAWPISIAPLTNESNASKDNLGTIRPDRQAMQSSVRQQRDRLSRWLTALAATLMIWLSWLLWRNWRDQKRLPFERAWHAIARLDTANNNPLAWQQMHWAMNETAGRVVHANSIDALLIKAPHLRSLRTELDTFFTHSNQRFFARTVPAQPFDLISLCRALQRIERQAER